MLSSLPLCPGLWAQWLPSARRPEAPREVGAGRSTIGAEGHSPRPTLALCTDTGLNSSVPEP